MPESAEGMPKFEIKPETRIRLIQQSYLRLIVDIAKAFTDKYGEEAWEILRKIAYNIGLERTVKMKQRFQIDPKDLRSIVNALAIEAYVFLAKPEDNKLVELTPKRLVGHTYNCAQAQQLSRCPDLCMRFFDYIDQATYDSLGVKIKRYEVPLRIPKGDAYCETILEIE